MILFLHLYFTDLEKAKLNFDKYLTSQIASTFEEIQSLSTELNSLEQRERKLVSDIKNSINQITEKTEGKSFSGMLGDSVRDSIKGTLGRTVETMAGTPKKIAETAADIKKLATQRQCDAQFISGFNNLLNTCSREELVGVYNKIAELMIQKKHFFSPRLEKEMEKLPILDYNPTKEQMVEVNASALDVSQDNKNTITKLQRKIDKKLRVSEKLKKLEGKSKKRIINTKIDNSDTISNPSSNESQV